MATLNTAREYRHCYNFSYVTSTLFLSRHTAYPLSIVVQYLGDRLAHVLIQNFSNRPRGFYTVAQKYENLYFF